MGTALRISSLTAKVPVLIIGGGLAGFTAALSLHRAGIQNRLIMPESKFTQHPRSGVFLAGSAIRILDRLGIGSQYRALGIPIHQLEIQDTRGKNVMSLNLDHLGTEVWTVPRESLQQLLLEAIPSDSVHASTKLRSLFVDETSVRVQIQEGSKGLTLPTHPPISSVKANFVIGADGLNSTVRTFMSRPVMTVPSGTVVWRAVVRNHDLENFPRHVGREIWEPNRRFGFARMNREEVVWWAVVSNFREVILRPFSPHLERLFQNFPLHVIELISSVESDRDISRAEMKRVWPEQFPWVEDGAISRIALVGDAGRPDSTGNFHIGHTLAVEDSYLLANCLAEQKERGMLKEGPRLERYEQSRAERTRTTSQLVSRFMRLSTASSSFTRYLARKFLSLSIERMAVYGTPTISLMVSDEYQS